MRRQLPLGAKAPFFTRFDVDLGAAGLGASLSPVSVGGAQAAEARLVVMGKRAASVNVVVGKSKTSAPISPS